MNTSARGMSFGEFSRHRWLRQVLERSPVDPVGIGDDCCVLDILPDEYLLVSSDRVPLSAYRRRFAYIGELCVVHNLSDVICKGGRPLGLLVDTFMPKDLQDDAWKEIITAAQERCRRYDAYILGGDTKEAPTLSVVGCALGTVKKDRLLLRSGARPGDVCAVTLAGGEKVGVPWAYHVIDSLQIPVAQEHREWMEKEFFARNLVLPYKETLAANAEKGIMASIDASDGIGGALHLICHASGVGVQVLHKNMCDVVHEAAMTLASSLGVDPVAFAFSPGFTWENVFAVDPEAIAAVEARVAAAGGRLMTLGHFVREPGASIEMGDGRVRDLALYYNEGFRDERYLSNSVEAWRAHRFILD